MDLKCPLVLVTWEVKGAKPGKVKGTKQKGRLGTLTTMGKYNFRGTNGDLLFPGLSESEPVYSISTGALYVTPYSQIYCEKLKMCRFSS
jgi:hypothetical protein